MPRRTLEEINALLLEDVASSDGAVEPLDLRAVATRKIQPQKAAHRAWGTLDEGNVSDRVSSEQFVQIVRADDMHVGTFPFVDEADVVGNLPVRSEEPSPDHRRVGSYHDNQEDNGVIVDELMMEEDMVAALRSMRPPSENMLPPGYVQPGASGFDYAVGFSGTGKVSS